MDYWSRILALTSGRVGVFAELCWVAWHVQYWFIILPISKSIPGHRAMLLAKVFTWTIPKCAIYRMAKKMWWLLFGGSAGFLHERPSLRSNNSYWLALSCYSVIKSCLFRCCYSVSKSCLTLCDPMDLACQAPLSMGFPRQEYWDWEATSFSRGSSQPRNWTCISYLAGRFFTAEPPVKGLALSSLNLFLTDFLLYT